MRGIKISGRGFTLIEMLIVVAIIGVLIGLLLPVIGVIQNKARVRATKSLIEGLQTALQRYYTQFDSYPPSNTSFLPGDPIIDQYSLYNYLCGLDGRGPTQKFNGTVRRYEPFYTPPPELISKTSSGVTIIDSWGKPIVYLNCKAYTDRQLASNSTYTSVGDLTCHNPNTFDLYSTGPDRQKDPNHNNKDDNGNGLVDEPAELVDDITNYPGS